MTDMTEHLNDLIKEEIVLRASLDKNILAQRAITTKMYLPSGVKVGDTVLLSVGTRKKIGTIDRLEFSGNEPYLVWIRLHIAQGKPGKRMVSCFYPDKITKI